MEWFEKWFDDLYLQLYSHRNDDDAKKQIQLIIKTINPSKSEKILDLGCGEGRHCKIFQNKGYSVEGIDLSKILINSGKNKNPDVNIKIGDMRKIEGKYHLILSLFTSFGYFETDEENLEIIKSVSNALLPHGYYWLDFLNTNYLQNNLIPTTEKVLNNGVKVLEKRKIENNFVFKEIIFSSGEIYTERVKLYDKKSLENMFLKASLKPIDIFGDYLGSTWSENSTRTIIYGKKV